MNLNSVPIFFESGTDMKTFHEELIKSTGNEGKKMEVYAILREILAKILKKYQ